MYLAMSNTKTREGMPWILFNFSLPYSLEMRSLTEPRVLGWQLTNPSHFPVSVPTSAGVVGVYGHVRLFT